MRASIRLVVAQVLVVTTTVACAPPTLPTPPPSTIEALGGPEWRVVLRTRFTNSGAPFEERWEYDAQGRPLAIDERVACYCVDERRETSFFRYENNVATRVLDRGADGELDITSIVNRDAAGRVEFVDTTHTLGPDPVRTTTTYGYDDAGRALTATTATGDDVDVTSVVRDDGGRVIEHSENGQTGTRVEYDDAGRTTRIESLLSTDVTTFTYDADGRLIAQRSFRPDNFDITNTFTYDDDGRLVASRATDTDAPAVALSEAAYQYDDAGRLLVHDTIDHRSGVSSSSRTTYDADGRPVAFERFQNGERLGGSTTTYAQPDADTVEVTVVFEGDEDRPVVTTLQRFDAVAADPFELPSFAVPFPNAAPRFAEPFPLGR